MNDLNCLLGGEGHSWGLLSAVSDNARVLDGTTPRSALTIHKGFPQYWAIYAISRT